MKLQITKEQLNELSEYQKQKLNSIWIPEKHDLALAKICKDAVNAEYEYYEFVIGDIEVYESVYHDLHVTLWDIKTMDQEDNKDLQEVELEDEEDHLNQEREVKWYEEESTPWYEENQLDEESNGLDIDNSFEMIQPSSFNKEECLPLLNIGQMLRILQDLRYGQGAFYLDIQQNKKSAIGPDIYMYHRGGNEYEGEEICDVLWEKIESLL